MTPTLSADPTPSPTLDFISSAQLPTTISSEPGLLNYTPDQCMEQIISIEGKYIIHL